MPTGREGRKEYDFLTVTYVNTKKPFEESNKI
jgi:hypothetical protein